MKFVRTAAVAVIVAGDVTSAWAADLVLMTEPTAVVDTTFVDSPIYVQLLGGVTGGLDATFYLGDDVDGVDPTRPGYAAAAAVGVVVYDGFSVEADVLRTFRNEEADGGDTYGTTSLMGNVKYTAGLNDMFSLYGAVGLGYIWVDNYDGPPVDVQYDFGGFGYQLIAGASAQFTDNVAGLLEVRYQDSFHDYDLGGTATLDLPTVSVLAGIKLSF